MVRNSAGINGCAGSLRRTGLGSKFPASRVLTGSFGDFEAWLVNSTANSYVNSVA